MIIIVQILSISASLSSILLILTIPSLKHSLLCPKQLENDPQCGPHHTRGAYEFRSVILNKMASAASPANHRCSQDSLLYSPFRILVIAITCAYFDYVNSDSVDPKQKASKMSGKGRHIRMKSRGGNDGSALPSAYQLTRQLPCYRSPQV